MKTIIPVFLFAASVTCAQPAPVARPASDNCEWFRYAKYLEAQIAYMKSLPPPPSPDVAALKDQNAQILQRLTLLCSTARVAHVAVYPTQEQVTLTWQWPANVANPAGFLVDRSTDGENFRPVGTATGADRTFSDMKVPAGLYTYRVRAISVTGVPLDPASIVKWEAGK